MSKKNNFKKNNLYLMSPEGRVELGEYDVGLSDLPIIMRLPGDGFNFKYFRPYHDNDTITFSERKNINWLENSITPLSEILWWDGFRPTHKWKIVEVNFVNKTLKLRCYWEDHTWYGGTYSYQYFCEKFYKFKG